MTKKCGNVDRDDCTPDVVVEVGCSFEPERRETLPRRLRRILRIHRYSDSLLWSGDYDSIIQRSIAIMIYEEQARFVVWNLFYLFGALLERGNENIKLDAVCMNFHAEVKAAKSITRQAFAASL